MEFLWCRWFGGVGLHVNAASDGGLSLLNCPLEFVKFLISLCASSQFSSRPTRIMINDVKKAYFYAPATRRVFVALPQEDKLAGEEDMCALLKRSLYGTRDAA